MQHIQNTKVATLLPPQLKDNGDFANNTYVDTAGWRHLRILFITGASDAAIGSTAEGTAPKVEACDTTDGTYAAITSAALADAIAADTEANKIFAIDVDLNKAHGRYVRVNTPHSGDGTTGSNLCILGILSEPDVAPASATEAGLQEWIKA